VIEVLRVIVIEALKVTGYLAMVAAFLAVFYVAVVRPYLRDES